MGLGSAGLGPTGLGLTGISLHFTYKAMSSVTGFSQSKAAVPSSSVYHPWKS